MGWRSYLVDSRSGYVRESQLLKLFCKARAVYAVIDLDEIKYCCESNYRENYSVGKCHYDHSHI